MSSIFVGTEYAQAKDIVVKSVEELQEAVLEKKEDLNVKFADDFPIEEDFSLLMYNDVNVVMDAENRKMKNKISIMYCWGGNAKENPQLVLKNFNFDGEQKNKLVLELCTRVPQIKMVQQILITAI